MKLIIAYDPGKTTGVARAIIGSNNCLSMLLSNEINICNDSRNLVDLCIAEDMWNDVVVITETSSGSDGILPAFVRGKIEEHHLKNAEYEDYPCKIVNQSPVQRRGEMSNAKLILKNRMYPLIPHRVDAMAHLLTYLRANDMGLYTDVMREAK